MGLAKKGGKEVLSSTHREEGGSKKEGGEGGAGTLRTGPVYQRPESAGGGVKTSYQPKIIGKVETKLPVLNISSEDRVGGRGCMFTSTALRIAFGGVGGVNSGVEPMIAKAIYSEHGRHGKEGKLYIKKDKNKERKKWGHHDQHSGATHPVEEKQQSARKGPSGVHIRRNGGRKMTQPEYLNRRKKNTTSKNTRPISAAPVSDDRGVTALPREGEEKSEDKRADSNLTLSVGKRRKRPVTKEAQIPGENRRKKKAETEGKKKIKGKVCGGEE